MAKETKQDRIVRGIFDQLIEHIHELKTMETSGTCKESDVERWSASFLKNCLGYTASTGYSIRSQESKGNLRPDLLVLKDDKPVFLVEVKKLGFNFERSDFRSGKVQLTEYLNAVGNVKWGLLTNGVEWKLYDFSNPKVGGIEIGRFDLKCGEGETFSTERKLVEELCYDFLLDFHESSCAANLWQDLGKEATAFSPDSLARAVLSSDVIKYIARSIRGEHEYKANLEILTDKVYWLLENGLNDVPGWNEAKSSEYQKYIKSQKRSARKTKRKPSNNKTEVVTETSNLALSNSNESIQNNSNIQTDENKVVA